MTEREFKARTKILALNVIRLVNELPANGTSGVLGRQLVRSGTAVGANYRAACRAKSARDMILKLSFVEEEADESLYWLELLVESGSTSSFEAKPLSDEFLEILAMTVASIHTLRRQSPIPNR